MIETATAIRIREATADDVEDLVRMMQRFHAESIYRDLFALNPEFLRQFIPLVLAGGDGTCFVADRDGILVGMIGIVTTPHLMSGQPVAMELCWWIEPEARGGRAALWLIRAAEAWTIGKGAVVLQLAAPNERVAGFYERLGYTRVETHYQKKLGTWAGESCQE